MLDRIEYISIKYITVQFAVPDEGVTALEEVSLDIYREEFFSVIGPSGCGKSTLLRCINLLEDPSSGSIEVGDDSDLVLAMVTRTVTPSQQTP